MSPWVMVMVMGAGAITVLIQVTILAIIRVTIPATITEAGITTVILSVMAVIFNTAATLMAGPPISRVLQLPTRRAFPAVAVIPKPQEAEAIPEAAAIAAATTNRTL
jgi:hypothetical protein